MSDSSEEPQEGIGELESPRINPYQIEPDFRPAVQSIDAATEPVEHRLWTIPLMLLAVIMIYFVVNIFSFILAELVVFGEVVAPSEDTMAQIFNSRIGFCLLLIPSQLAIFIPPLIAGYVSPVPTRERLGIVRGCWPPWAFVAAAIATPLVGLLTTFVLSPFVSESEHLKQLTSAFRNHATSGFLIPTLLMVGGLPAFCEELLFRGYIQTRIAARLGGVAAVLIASVLFALFHFDPIHVVAVLPIGLWLGFVRHASGSLIPAMIAHGVNNALSVVSVIPDETEVFDTPNNWLTYLVLLLGIPAFFGCVYAGLKYSFSNRSQLNQVDLPTEFQES